VAYLKAHGAVSGKTSTVKKIANSVSAPSALSMMKRNPARPSNSSKAHGVDDLAEDTGLVLSSRKSDRRGSIPTMTAIPAGLVRPPRGAAAAAPGADDANGPALLKLGKLTKLSKGGLTANWNRRSFAIVGSSLYYSDSLKSLCKPMQAKLFCELAGSTVGLLPDAARFSMPGRSSLPPSIFVISWETASESPAGAEDQVLLLAGDSEKHSTEWVSALQRAGPLPPCSPERVAQLVKAESTQPTAPGLSHFVEDSEDIL